VRRIAPTVFGVPVLVPPPGEYVADGAARQAAWVLAASGPTSISPGPAPAANRAPDWSAALGDVLRYDAPVTAGLAERYALAAQRYLPRASQTAIVG
jgi:xylulokinase